MNKRKGYTFFMTEKSKKWVSELKCPNCGKPKEEWNRRTDWRCCSKKCSDKFYKNYGFISWQSVRRSALKRDNYICVNCGATGGGVKLCGDHIIPIALGGDEFDLKNVQTLCDFCHKIKTKEDIRKISKRKRIDKIINGGQKTL